MTKDQECKEELYLKEIHNSVRATGVIDLHTYFYYKGFEACPICNEWITMRTKPKVTN